MKPDPRDITITVEQVMALQPCSAYPLGRVEELWAGRPFLTPLQVCELDIPAKDRLWLLFRVLDDRTMRLHACLSAERALGFVKNPHPDSLKAIEVARRFADGNATKEELSAAYDAAAYAAASASADASAAAYAAASAAAYDAAAAAYAAAYDAAAADRKKSWAAALEDMRKLLGAP